MGKEAIAGTGHANTTIASSTQLAGIVYMVENMKFKEDKYSGYMYCHNPKHPLANKGGKVMEHVYVMSEHIGRPLHKGECVHHIDRNRKNNSIENLMLLTHAEHLKLHAIEDKNTEYVTTNCFQCGRKLFGTQKQDKKYCSISCSSKAQVKFEISKEELKKLVWEYPTVQLAKFFGISDKAIEKRCKQLKVEKPPRGYWAKKYASKVSLPAPNNKGII